MATKLLRRARRLALEGLEPRQFLSGVSPLDSGGPLPTNFVANNDSFTTDENAALLIRADQLLANDTPGSASFLDAAWSLFAGGSTGAASTDDLLFIHHSVGDNWLSSGLNVVLVSKSYVDQRNDITYGTVLAPDAGRPASLGAIPGDQTNMNHWVFWFNDYLQGIKTHGAATGVNKIVMFKSCYPISNIDSDGTSPGDPFSDAQALTNYQAVYHHPDGAGHTYAYNSYNYAALEDVFAANPDTLFIPVTAPPRNYAPGDATNDAEGHRARQFNNWLKNDWQTSYNTAHPGLNNVAVFDFFNVLAYSDADPSHPNRLRAEYGGASGDSHPNSVGNAQATSVFAGAAMTIVSFTQPQHGTLGDNGDGTYTYTPDSCYHGTDTFTYTANDGGPNSIATVSIAVVDPLGSVGFSQQSHQNLTESDAWYRLTTAHQGQLTLEATFAGALDTVRVALCDANRNELATASAVEGRLRLDRLVDAGATYHVHVTGTNADASLSLVNLVNRSGTALTVHGTAGDDALVVDASTGRRVTIDGVEYRYTDVEVTSIVFDGGTGSNTALLVGTPGDDRADFSPGSAQLAGTGLLVNVIHTGSITIQGGGGNDVAYLRDSVGDDTFTAAPLYGQLATGSGVLSRAEGFDAVHAYAINGGFDTAFLYDSAGDDTFQAEPTCARMYGTAFHNRAKFFEAVHAYSTVGGFDTAFLHDSVGNDTFSAMPTSATLYGTGYFNRARLFEAVHAYAVNGGTDTANLYDSAGDDILEATPAYARLYGAGYSNRAKSFERVNVFATAGGHDEAFLVDSPRTDYLEAGSNWVRLSNAAIPFANWVSGFDQVTARATHAHNMAHVAPTVDFLILQGVWDPV